MSSREVINLANMCQYYQGKSPSDILGITDSYTSYCLNEAIMYIISKLNNGDKPNFDLLDENKKARHYTSFSDLYNKFK